MPTRFPDWLVPMAATLTEERFAGPDWLFERKLDGIRMLAYRNGRHVQLYSRNRLLLRYPTVTHAIAALPVRNIILDGEAAWDPSHSLGARNRSPVLYHVFDILWLDGRDVTRLPLEQRRALLKQLPLAPPLGRVPEIRGDTPWERACREGWEGVIAKRRGSTYEHRRSPHWLKMKCEATQELVVGGFTDPQRTRAGLGALLVGYFDGGDSRNERSPRVSDANEPGARSGAGGPRESASRGSGGEAPGRKKDFVFAGKVGTGFDTRLLLELRARLDRLEIPTPPFTKTKGLPRLRAHWVRPALVVQVAFTEWTVHGKLRHPRFIAVRTDKAARDVVRESR
jgi:bifunctional non-homologous end joining protein LigD